MPDRIKKHKLFYILLSLFLAYELGFPIYNIVYYDSLNLRRGPEDNFIYSLGHFEPGGYIWFHYYDERGTAFDGYDGWNRDCCIFSIEPIISERLEKNGVRWAAIDYKNGFSRCTDEYCNNIYGDFVLHIPNSSALRGEKIPVKTTIMYPAINFRESHTFEFVIDRGFGEFSILNTLGGPDPESKLLYFVVNFNILFFGMFAYGSRIKFEIKKAISSFQYRKE